MEHDHLCVSTAAGRNECSSISGLVVEYIVAIDVTRVRFPADAFLAGRYLLHGRRLWAATTKAQFLPDKRGRERDTNERERERDANKRGRERDANKRGREREPNPRGETPSA